MEIDIRQKGTPVPTRFGIYYVGDILEAEIYEKTSAGGSGKRTYMGKLVYHEHEARFLLRAYEGLSFSLDFTKQPKVIRKWNEEKPSFTKTVHIPSKKLQELQNFLDSIEGDGTQNTVETFTVEFGDRGYGDIQVDIKVCDGHPPFVDPVIFRNGHEITCLEPDGDLLGEYIFSDIDGVDYIVYVEEEKS